jgi:hypothetical protein
VTGKDDIYCALVLATLGNIPAEDHHTNEANNEVEISTKSNELLRVTRKAEVQLTKILLLRPNCQINLVLSKYTFIKNRI